MGKVRIEKRRKINPQMNGNILVYRSLLQLTPKHIRNSCCHIDRAHEEHMDETC